MLPLTPTTYSEVGAVRGDTLSRRGDNLCDLPLHETTFLLRDLYVTYVTRRSKGDKEHQPIYMGECLALAS